jgi:hypothetical protein
MKENTKEASAVAEPLADKQELKSLFATFALFGGYSFDFNPDRLDIRQSNQTRGILNLVNTPQNYMQML